MKKLLLSVVAVGAMATGGVASAQEGLGNVLPQILGSVLGNNAGYPGTVVAQGNYPIGTVYTDQSGRRVLVDQNGQHVLVDQNVTVNGRRVVEDATGRLQVLDADGTYIHPVNGWRMYVTPDGRHLPVNTNTVQARRIQQGGDVFRDRRDGARDDRRYDDRYRDRDGDGVRDNRDRYPDDPRYR